jgi:hypothetical protein
VNLTKLYLLLQKLSSRPFVCFPLALSFYQSNKQIN